MSKSLSSIVRTATTSLFEKGEVQAIGEYFSKEYVVHLTDQSYSGGHKIVQAAIVQIRNAFPDIRVQVDLLVESIDRVAWQRTLRGTQQGAYKGFPASGRHLVWRDMVVSRFDNGLIVEEWVTTDLAERLLLSRKN